MLLKNKKCENKDFLQNWPCQYYDIPTGKERMDALHAAQNMGIASSSDVYRRRLCEKRFFSQSNDGTVDAFLHAWMMIKASSAAGISFFGKRKLTEELKTYMEELCLLHYELENEEESAILTEEWRDFARCFISSCVGSKGYCSTLFGFVPIKDATIAEKICTEILLVTRDYPSKLGLSDYFTPLRTIMCDTCCAMIEGSENYLRSK